MLLCPVHQFLFQPGILARRARVGSLGAIRHFDLVACSAGADGGSDAEREAVARRHPAARARARASAARRVPGWRGLARVGAGRGRRDSRDGDVGRHVGHARRVDARPADGELPDGPLRPGTVRANLFHGFATIERGAPRGSTSWPAVRRLGPGVGAALGNLVGRVVRREPAYPGPARARSTVPPRLRERDDRPPSPSTNRSMWRARATSSAKPGAVGRRAPNSEAIARRSGSMCCGKSAAVCVFGATTVSSDGCAGLRARPCRRAQTAL